MTYRPSVQWLTLLVVLSFAGTVELAHGAPKRPSKSAFPCSISADQFKQLAGKNPGGAQACLNMDHYAQTHGGSFAFMCDDATGEISCCDNSSCVSLGSAARGTMPGMRNPPSGTLQPQPSPPGGRPGMAPQGGVRSRGIEEAPTSEPGEPPDERQRTPPTN